MAYIGKQGISSTTLTSKTLSTMVGNGSTDTLTLSPAPDSVNDVAIYLDGVFQTPGTEYTLSGSTITFTTAPANNVFVCALVGGGEHIGTPMDNSIGTDKLVDGTLTNVKIDAVSTSKVSGTLPALNANAVTGLNAANLVGSAMPAIDGSNLTGISSFTKNANDPATNTNGTLGDIWANTTSGELYVLTDATTNANIWTNVGPGTGNQPLLPPSGGIITTDGDYKVHTFTSSGTFEITDISVVLNSQVDYLVVAGGGGGGAAGGGGGAGGYKTDTGVTVSATSYVVTVGAGGVGSEGFPNYAVDQTSGSNSVLATLNITATGGGRGARSGPDLASSTGGSGGGGAMGSATASASGTGSEGNAGGTGGGSGINRYGGGGGGAGAVGANGASPATGGAGGVGLSNSITGSAVYYAGGGGGGGDSRTGGGTGGAGGNGGGSAGMYSNANATAAVANKGGGGGASGYGNPSPYVGNGAAGGSGIVIIRYKFQ